MAKDYKIRLAGQDYALRYRMRDRAAIDRRLLELTGNHLGKALLSEFFEEHVIVLWGGLRHLEMKPELSTEKLMDLIEQYQDEGGDFYSDLYRPVVVRAVCEAKLVGIIPQNVIDAMCGGGGGPMAARQGGAAITPQ